MTSNGFRFWSEEHLPFGANGLVVCLILVRIGFSSGILAEVFNYGSNYGSTIIRPNVCQIIVDF